MNFPSVADVDRIAGLGDSIVRNLQITQCYYELSQAMREWSGAGANWCTFATWASKQAGQSIRGQDLVRRFEDHFRHAPEIAAAVAALVEVLGQVGLPWKAQVLIERILAVLDAPAVLARVSDAVARGNQKVFAEIGREFARFLALCGHETAFQAETFSRFCAELRPGDPPDGQRLLRDAFVTYGEARFASAPDAKSELQFLANLLIGFHEQTRLQPEISAALEAAIDADQVKRSILHWLFPGPWLRLRYQISGMLGGKPPLDEAIDLLLWEAQRKMRQVITHHLMTLQLSGEILELGYDLRASFPPPLAQIVNPKLREWLARIDPTPDSIAASGARDWAQFDDRMHFITDLFRSYHDRPALFDPPFVAEQVVELQAGHRPAGPL